MWEIVHHQTETLGIFTSEQYSQRHMPPTLKSSGHRMYIDVSANEESVLYARYYSQQAMDAGTIPHISYQENTKTY